MNALLCGGVCSPCFTPLHAAVVCNNTSCDFSCDPGFVRAGGACIDVDECSTNNGGCAANASCTNTVGARTCTCHSGFTGDGITCVDLNECGASNGGCDVNATCFNTPGGFTCTCNTGYGGSGETCVLTDPTAQIAAIRAAADAVGADGGVAPAGLAVTGAYVTALKPLTAAASASSDPAGFFLQTDGLSGPAIFVAVDPSTVGGGLSVGDRISFTVNAEAGALSKVKGGPRTVLKLGPVTKTVGGPGAPAAQEVSGVDFNAAGAIDDLESELVTMTGTVLGGGNHDGGAFASAGPGYSALHFVTAATSASAADGGSPLRLRVPNAVADALQAANPDLFNCLATLTSMPLWRDFTTAQPSAWVADSLALTCIGGACEHAVPTGHAGWATLTFDNVGTTYTLRGFGGEDAQLIGDPGCGAASANKVLQANRPSSAPFWAGTEVSTGAGFTIAAVPFSTGATHMSMRSRSPVSGIHVRLRLEDSTDPTHSVETEALTTQADAWETLIFDFASNAAGSPALNLNYTYDHLMVFFDYSSAGSAANARTYFADDIAFIGP